MENTLLNNGMATNNPQANVNGNQTNSMQNGIPNTQQGNTISPVTIPIQIQPQVQQGQVQAPNVAQPNNNLQVNNNQNYNAPTPQVYQGNQNNNMINFDQIYSSYKNAYGNTYNSNQNVSSSGIKKTSIGTTIVTPTVTNLNSVAGQYQSAYADTINGIIGNMLSNISNGFQYDPTTDNSLRVATEYSANATMQSLAGSGVLNSSATSERVARIVADLIPQYEEKAHSRWTEYLGQLADTAQLVMNFDNQQFKYWADAKDREFAEKEFNYKKQQDALEQAWKRVDELGFADNEASAVLGVKVGTLSKSAREAKEQREFELNKMREQYELERENDIAIAKLKSELSMREARYNADLEMETYSNKANIDQANTLERMREQSALNKDEASYQAGLDVWKNKELSDYQLKNDKDLYGYRAGVDLWKDKEYATHQAELDRETYSQRAGVDVWKSKVVSDYQLNNDKALAKYTTNLDTKAYKEKSDYSTANSIKEYNAKAKTDLANSKELSDYNTNNNIRQYNETTAKNATSTSGKSTRSLSDYQNLIKNRWGNIDPVTGQVSVKDNDAVWYYLANEYENGNISKSDVNYLIGMYGITSPSALRTITSSTTQSANTNNNSSSSKIKVASNTYLNNSENKTQSTLNNISNSEFGADYSKLSKTDKILAYSIYNNSKR